MRIDAHASALNRSLNFNDSGVPQIPAGLSQVPAGLPRRPMNCVQIWMSAACSGS
jgi:hypothetical protein